jgi:HK97 family phage prohead protease
LEIRIKDDSVEIDGYVNAIERKSKPLNSRIGKFVERIKKGAFKRAIDRNDNIRILLNHDWNHDLGGTKDGNLKLTEDNIGLRARAIINDHDVAEKARNGDLVGWSFGFTDRDVDTHDEGGMTTRDVKDLDLYEVSLLDRTKTPAYDGTLVSVRSDDEIQYHGEPCITEINTRDDSTPKEEPQKPIDYSKYEEMIKEMKGEKE